MVEHHKSADTRRRYEAAILDSDKRPLSAARPVPNLWTRTPPVFRTTCAPARITLLPKWAQPHCVCSAIDPAHLWIPPSLAPSAVSAQPKPRMNGHEREWGEPDADLNCLCSAHQLLSVSPPAAAVAVPAPGRVAFAVQLNPYGSGGKGRSFRRRGAMESYRARSRKWDPG
jgi:hypothetical protein